VKRGSLVRIPLRNRTEMGIVLDVDVEPELPLAQIKYVVGLEQTQPVLTPDLIDPRALDGLLLRDELRERHGGDDTSGRSQRHASPVLRFIGLGTRLGDDELAALERRAPKQAALYRFLSQQLNPRPLRKAELLKRLEIPASSCDALVERGCAGRDPWCGRARGLR
jgi:primosomal protein N' (replication factor Y)